ncbi:IS66 family insertion sequence element accessory protein TnpB [Mesorhizobium sp. Cs1299R1N3]|uniref:IS66 family insertion sequence element accessory protein TnpB n=1 Tax=Mesorhizobium sp. Cs1299R1N3 TaxID=3015173 RepID=UPI003FA57921
MMIVPAGVKVHLALGYTDMRKDLDGLAMLVQQTLKLDPFSGHLFAFRGKRASMLKILFWDGNGLWLFTKRLDQGSFAWPVMAGYDGSITLTPAQLAMLIEGIDWRVPERVIDKDAAGQLVTRKLIPVRSGRDHAASRTSKIAFRRANFRRR